MMTKKRKLTALAFGCALSVSCAFGGMIAQKTVSANTSPLTMLGASVRLDNNQGIRFTAQINGEPTENSTYHVMIVPAAWRNELVANANGDYYKYLTDVKELTDVDDPTTTEEDERDFINLECVPAYIDVDEDGQEEWVVRGTIKEVKYNNTNRQFFGVAYEEKSDGTRVYADNQDAGVRSCTYVAGAALNSGYYASDETKTGYLNNMINNAYNKVVLGNSETDEQSKAVFTLPEISAYNPVGTELDFYVNGINGLDLPEIEWNVEKPTDSKSIFDDKQKLVVFDEEGTLIVSTKVAGQDLVANVACGTYLETFSSYTEDAQTGDKTVNNIKSGAHFQHADATAGVYLESFTDSANITEYGVGKGVHTNSGCIPVRFNATATELSNILSDDNFYAINFRIVLKRTGSSQITNVPIKFFDLIEKSVATERWTNVILTKNDIFTNETLLSEFTDKKGIISAISDAFDLDGIGYIRKDSKAAARKLIHLQDKTELYIDDIQYLYETSENHFETFSGNANNITGAANFNKFENNEYLQFYTDKNGVTEYGVGKATMQFNSGSSGYIALRFNKTAEELKEIMSVVETITFRVLITDTDFADGASYPLSFFNLVDKTAYVNQWTDITLTREEIFNDTLVGKDVFGSEQNLIEATPHGFANAFASNGLGYLRKSSGSGTVYRMLFCKAYGGKSDTNVYIDDITYTLASAN